MFTDAFSTKQFNALEAHVTDYFRGVCIAVVAGDCRGTVSNGGGTGKERARVGLVRRCTMETGVLFVKKVHLF